MWSMNVCLSYKFFLCSWTIENNKIQIKITFLSKSLTVRLKIKLQTNSWNLLNKITSSIWFSIIPFLLFLSCSVVPIFLCRSAIVTIMFLIHWRVFHTLECEIYLYWRYSINFEMVFSSNSLQMIKKGIPHSHNSLR